jgi:formylglycine-generating enzyme required for sulfatase activity
MTRAPELPEPRPIEPAPFRSSRRARRRGLPVGRALSWGAVLALLVAVIGAGWVATTLQRIRVTVEPTPEAFALTGPEPRWELDGEFLVRPGSHTVTATRAGYAPLEATFDVRRGGARVFAFTLRELPGVLTIRGESEARPDVPLDAVEVAIDGAPAGATPLAPIELARGPHALRLTHPRHQPAELEIDVAGFGAEQVVEFALVPDWADVTVAADPPGAEVLADGVVVGRTPCAFELLAGRRELLIRAEGYEPWAHDLAIVAGQPVAITGVALQRLKGTLRITTDPPGAHITVGDRFAGASPVAVEVPPDVEATVRGALAGHAPAETTASVASQAERAVHLDLAPEFGVVELRVEPADAQLTIDGQPAGAAPTELRLPARPHRLGLSRRGYLGVERTVLPRPGVPARVAVSLAKKTPPKSLAAGNGSRLIRIDPAEFEMGAPRGQQGRRANETRRRIRLTRPFFIGEREVTNREYAEFDPNHRSGSAETIPLGGESRPVVRVSWDDAARFCNWLSVRDGLAPAYAERGGSMVPVGAMTTGYRLPTEAEWAYAARVHGSERPLKFPWGVGFPPPPGAGNFADESATVLLGRVIEGYDDGFVGASPVGSFDAGPSGLYDLGGNAAEWCHDWYTTYTYNPGLVEQDPMGPASGGHHVVRGSSWRHASQSALRLSYRDYSAAPRDDLGFRICRYVEREESPR